MLLIAEIGFNHEGNMDVAAQMIKAAAESGAGAAKFQTYRAEDIALPSSEHFAAIAEGELDLAQHKELASYAKECGIEFMSTPYSVGAVELLEEVGVSRYKIASMDLTNHELITAVLDTKKPIIVSTGMGTVSEIRETVEFCMKNAGTDLTLLHCISKYPAVTEEVNLDFMNFMKDEFSVKCGYSDHTVGIDVCLLAAALGASTIEKHFTLDTSLEGADHYHSADPAALKDLAQKAEVFEQALGKRSQIIESRPDLVNSEIYRRGLFAKGVMTESVVLQSENLFYCRPQGEKTVHGRFELEGRETKSGVALYERLDQTNTVLR